MTQKDSKELEPYSDQASSAIRTEEEELNRVVELVKLQYKTGYFEQEKIEDPVALYCELLREGEIDEQGVVDDCGPEFLEEVRKGLKEGKGIVVEKELSVEEIREELETDEKKQMEWYAKQVKQGRIKLEEILKDIELGFISKENARKFCLI